MDGTAGQKGAAAPPRIRDRAVLHTKLLLSLIILIHRAPFHHTAVAPVHPLHTEPPACASEKTSPARRAPPGPSSARSRGYMCTLKVICGPTAAYAFPFAIGRAHFHWDLGGTGNGRGVAIRDFIGCRLVVSAVARRPKGRQCLFWPLTILPLRKFWTCLST